jgi:tetratricopeptide (TPR) repeat protein
MRFVREYLSQFPDEDGLSYLNMRRAEGEALWHLGRQAEAEAVYRALVEKMPDQAWAYIGWADNYYLGRGAVKDYPAAEAILRRALARPNLEDREDVLQRLIDMYDEWGKPEMQPPLAAQLAQLETTDRIWSPLAHAKVEELTQAGAAPPGIQRPRRNDPCWCGSGKKYKRCHMKSDRA